jgi:hypothetical protein
MTSSLSSSITNESTFTNSNDFNNSTSKQLFAGLWHDVKLVEKLSSQKEAKLKKKCYIRHFSRLLLQFIQYHLYPSDSNREKKLHLIHNLLLKSKDLEEGKATSLNNLKKELSKFEKIVLMATENYYRKFPTPDAAATTLCEPATL